MKKMSLIERLKQIPDPRSRRRREYPLYALLAVLILAAAHGENSLRGMWMWAQARAEQLQRAPVLGLWAIRHFPSLGTFWYLLSKLDAGVLEQALQGWGNLEASSLALDGKTLRGSKRGKAQAALQVVVLASQQVGNILAQGEVPAGQELEAALALFERVDLEGKVVSADAGLLHATLTQKVVAKKGAILG